MRFLRPVGWGLTQAGEHPSTPPNTAHRGQKGSDSSSAEDQQWRILLEDLNHFFLLLTNTRTQRISARTQAGDISPAQKHLILIATEVLHGWSGPCHKSFHLSNLTTLLNTRSIWLSVWLSLLQVCFLKLVLNDTINLLNCLGIFENTKWLLLSFFFFLILIPYQEKKKKQKKSCWHSGIF